MSISFIYVGYIPRSEIARSNGNYLSLYEESSFIFFFNYMKLVGS